MRYMMDSESYDMGRAPDLVWVPGCLMAWVPWLGFTSIQLERPARYGVMLRS